MKKQKPNFTPRLQQALKIARETAKNVNSSIVDLDYVALGILSLQTGPIQTVLKGCNVDTSDFLRFIQEAIALKSVVKPETQGGKLSYANEVKKFLR